MDSNPRPGSARRRKLRAARLLRRVLIGVAAVGLSSALALYAIARIYFTGPRLAHWLAAKMTADNQGAWEIDSLDWSARLPIDLVTGDATPITVRGVRIYDRSHRLTLRVDRLEVSIHLAPIVRQAILGGPLLLDLDRLDLAGADVKVLEEDGRITLTDALTPRHPASPGGPSPSLAVRAQGIQLSNVDLEVAAGDTVMALRGIAEPAGEIAAATYHGELRSLGFRLHPRIDSGRLHLAGQDLTLDDLSTRELTLDGPFAQSARFDLGLSIEGAHLRLVGNLSHPFLPDARIDAYVGARHVGGLASALLPGQRFGGDGRLDLHVHGALQGGHPDVDGTIEDVTWAMPTGQGATVPLHLASIHASLQGAHLSGDGLSIAGLGGSLRGKASLDFERRRLSVDLWLADVDETVFLARADRERWGGRVSGHVAGTSSLWGFDDVNGENLDLELVRSGGSPLPPSVSVTGRARLVDLDRLEVNPVTLRAAGAAAKIDGDLELGSLRLRLAFHVDVPDLSPLSKALGMPQPLGGAAVLDANAKGSLDAPEIDGRILLKGAQVGTLLGGADLAADVGLRGGRISLSNLDLRALGGSLHGEGWIQMLDTARSGLRLLDHPILHLGLSGDALHVGLLGPLEGAVAGTASVEIQADGDATRPDAQVHLSIPTLSVLGDGYHGLSLAVRADKDGIHLDHLAIYRDAGDASLLGGGQIAWDGAVTSLDITATHFPFEAIPGVAGSGLPLTGDVSGELSLGGRIWPAFSPTLEAQVQIAHPRVRGQSLGQAYVSLEPRQGEPAAMIIDNIGGRIGDAALGGFAEIAPDTNAVVEVRFQDTPLEKFFPELERYGDVHATVSGTARITYQGTARKIAVHADLTSINATITSTTEDGRRRTFALANDEDLVFDVVDGVLRIQGAPRIVWGNGDSIIIQGSWGPEDGPPTALRLDGTVSLAVLEPFLESQCSRIGGEIETHVTLSRQPNRPLTASGWIALQHAALLPVGVDPADEITVPHGQIFLGPQGITRTDLTVTLDGRPLRITGSMDLADLLPTHLDLALRGLLSARWLEILLPDQVSDTAGAAAIDLALGGSATAPSLTGAISFGGTGFDVTPQSFPHAIHVDRGTVDLAAADLSRDLTARAHQIVARVDDGMLTLDGAVAYTDGKLGDTDVKLAISELPVEASESIQADLSGRLDLTGDADSGLALTGGLQIVDGSFRSDVDPSGLLVSRSHVREEQPGFWKQSPLLKAMRLDLKLTTPGTFNVTDNMFNMQLNGDDIEVSGTLDDPRLGGRIETVPGGSFQPLSRVRFTLDSGGYVKFDPSLAILDGQLNIPATTLFTDTNGVDHNIHVLLTGTLAKLVPLFSSDDGLDQGQIVFLLLSGRSEQQALATLSGNTGAIAGANVTGSSSDYAEKAVTSTILSHALAPPLERFIHFDVIRPEISTDSVDIYVEKRFAGRRFAAGGGVDDNFIYGTTGNFNFTLRSNDHLSLNASGQSFKRGENGVQADYTRATFGLKLQWTVR